MIIVKKITFNEIFPTWYNYLWKGRKSEIKPTNPIKFMGGYNKSIEDSIPSFFGAIDKDKCVGVNSGFATNINLYRSRGLYIHKNWRKRGIAVLLLRAVEEQALQEDKKILWSMPRKSALKTYEKFGFIQTSTFFDKDVEFGPNCFVCKYIKKNN